MSWIIDLFGGGGLGTIFSGISGLIGGYLTKRENRLTLQLQNSHELAMAEQDRLSAEAERAAAIAIADKQLEIAQTEGEIQKDIIATQGAADVEEMEAKAFATGLAMANKPTGYPGVDKFRALTRPLITWSLYFFVIVMFGFLQWKVGEIVAEDTDLLVQLYVYLVQSVIYLFIMAVSWWFMSRGEKSIKAIRGLLK